MAAVTEAEESGDDRTLGLPITRARRNRGGGKVCAGRLLSWSEGLANARLVRGRTTNKEQEHGRRGTDRHRLLLGLAHRPRYAVRGRRSKPLSRPRSSPDEFRRESKPHNDGGYARGRPTRTVTDPVSVGRLRQEETGEHSLSWFLSRDNLRHDAAFNAVHLAEPLLERSHR
jgi:hypothetical protein